MIPDVFQPRSHIGLCFLHIIAEQALAEAVAAVSSTHLGDNQEGRCSVFVLTSRHYIIHSLIGCIPAAILLKFTFTWNDEPADRITRVVPVDQRQIIVIDPKANFLE